MAVVPEVVLHICARATLNHEPIYWHCVRYSSGHIPVSWQVFAIVIVPVTPIDFFLSDL